MRISYQTFALHKEGRNFDDYEDAYCPAGINGLSIHTEAHTNVAQFHAAVCDGATDSCFSQYWARLLAIGYVKHQWGNDFGPAAIAAEQSLWKQELNTKELPWYAEEKAEQGAFAAMIGVSIFEEGQRWLALGIGDSCLFHTRGGELISSFPLTSPEQFNSFPVLIGSLPERNSNVFDATKNVIQQQWANGDVFFLMSDALACWFLTELQDSPQIVEWLSQVQSHEEFEDVVGKERKTLNLTGNFRMRDDDATFTRIIVNGKLIFIHSRICLRSLSRK